MVFCCCSCSVVLIITHFDDCELRFDDSSQTPERFWFCVGCWVVATTGKIIIQNKLKTRVILTEDNKKEVLLVGKDSSIQHAEFQARFGWFWRCWKKLPHHTIYSSTFCGRIIYYVYMLNVLLIILTPTRNMIPPWKTVMYHRVK